MALQALSISLTGQQCKGMLQQRIQPMNEQKLLVQQTLDELKTSYSALDVSEKDVENIVVHLKERLQDVSPDIVKATLSSLIDEIWVNPIGENRERLIRVKGSYLPSTRVCMVTPRGRDTSFLSI